MTETPSPSSSPAPDDSTRDLPGPPAPTVWPTVGFTDVDAGVAFCTETLGFTVTALYRGDDGTVAHAEARWPDGGGVMFGTRGKEGDWGTLGPQGLYVVAAEPATVDAAYARVQQAEGVEVVTALEDTDYGSHQFACRDRDDNLWCLGTYRGA
ncbi:VOC family protein [Ornithinicoccus halotolerans]|uniref:VOC family protein n=1 Tax=Ornithinicoccus halotolerans TaxID=1748220 RepID=UPI0012950C38|nr:VOC family protein [Ornithinicoccus halotolerans]